METGAVTEESIRVEGFAAPPLLGGARRVLLGITGLSLVLGLWRLFARHVLGKARRGRLSVDEEGIRFEETTKLGGREVEVARESFARAQVLSARLETRYPQLPIFVGMLGLGLGIFVGIVWLLDGIQGEFTPWIAGGMGILMAGIALDLALSSLAASMPGTTAVELYLPGGRRVRLLGCDPQQAERLVRWLQR